MTSPSLPIRFERSSSSVVAVQLLRRVDAAAALAAALADLVGSAQNRASEAALGEALVDALDRARQLQHSIGESLDALVSSRGSVGGAGGADGDVHEVQGAAAGHDSPSSDGGGSSLPPAGGRGKRGRSS